MCEDSISFDFLIKYSLAGLSSLKTWSRKKNIIFFLVVLMENKNGGVSKITMPDSTGKKIRKHTLGHMPSNYTQQNGKQVFTSCRTGLSTQERIRWGLVVYVPTILRLPGFTKNKGG
jgi:hypothetical protein